MPPESSYSKAEDVTSTYVAHSKVVWQWDRCDTIKADRKQTRQSILEQMSHHDSYTLSMQETNWVSYGPQVSDQIERAFQSGLERCRVKQGGTKPVELFLYDKLQYDPVTGLAHRIRRLGTESPFQKVSRAIRSFLYQIATGSLKHKTFLRFKKETGEGNWKKKKVRPPLIKSCKWIHQQHLFVPVQVTMILLYTVFLGFDAQLNKPGMSSSSTQNVFNILEHCFCGFFTCELLIRLGAMEQRVRVQLFLKQVLTNQWFMFDLLLVLLMVLETWVLPLITGEDEAGLNQLATLRMLRLARLTRLGRVARLLSVFPEIGIMVKSMVSSLRAVVSVFLLMFLMLYTFAIIFKTQAEESECEDLFPTIESSMWFLLVHGSFMDNLSSSVDAIFSGDPALAVLFMAFVFLSNLMVLNMLIGLICEVASEVSQTEKTALQERLLQLDLAEFFDFFDTDGDKSMSLHEFELFLGNPDVKKTLEKRGVDLDSLDDLKDSLFEDEEDVSHDDLVETMIRLREGHGGPATMLDILALEKNLHRSNSKLFDKSSSELTRLSVLASNRVEPVIPLDASTASQSSNDVLQERRKEVPAEMSQEERLHVLCEDMCQQMKLLVSRQDATEASIKDMRQMMLQFVDRPTMLEEKATPTPAPTSAPLPALNQAAHVDVM